MVDKKLIDNDNNNDCTANDDIIDNNDESKYLDIIVDYISSAILRLKSKELLRLNEPTISNVFDISEMTGLNETPKLHQHTMEIEQADHDDFCNKSFHDFDNKGDL
ncbi:MAG TPA: hypothetical protein VLL98_05290 [Rickettsiales bacterium]|nr:hypothetical protein [Rickettsiales bacterium]